MKVLKWLKEARKQEKADTAQVTVAVSGIIKDVIDNMDDAVRRYNQQYDGNDRELFQITKEEIKQAYEEVDSSIVEDIRTAAANIKAFAQLQKDASAGIVEQEISPGVFLGHRRIPVNACCCYVPGGNYPLFSSALMLAIPAKVAGVSRIVACSPTMKGTGQINPLTVVAMDIAGVDEIYAVGGAHAVAAFSYGTEQIKPVDIIVGPGNRYVTEAKRQCFGQVGIDFIAGPSEVLVISDETGDAATIAADMLAQAEHDINARSILLTTSYVLAQQVEQQVQQQLSTLSTAAIAEKSWQDNGEIILCDSLTEAVALSNEYAPEHLELIVEQDQELLPLLTNYGSLFLGQNSAEVFGDYVSGTNHTLPTSKASRYTGGVWVGTFLKTCTHQRMTPEAARKLGAVAARMADAEGLCAHANAARIRG